MQAFTNITPLQLAAIATKFDLTDAEQQQITVQDFGGGRLTLTAYPDNPRHDEFLRHLVKLGVAEPDLSRPGRW